MDRDATGLTSTSAKPLGAKRRDVRAAGRRGEVRWVRAGHGRAAARVDRDEANKGLVPADVARRARPARWIECASATDARVGGRREDRDRGVERHALDGRLGRSIRRSVDHGIQAGLRGRIRDLFSWSLNATAARERQNGQCEEEAHRGARIALLRAPFGWRLDIRDQFLARVEFALAKALVVVAKAA